MRRISTVRRAFVVLTAVAVGVVAAPAGNATFPFRPGGGDVYDYTRLKITNGSCDDLPDGEPRPAGSDLPNNFDCREDFKLTSYAAQPGDADYDPLVADNPQELNGVKGSSTNKAWEVTTGRPDVVIAVMDSGIRWDEKRPNLVNKFFLNRGELPVPGGNAKGRSLREVDANRDGVFNVKDYAGDSRAKDFADDGNELLDPSDLIRVFSDGKDDDGNGYVDDISGWDFFENDNDANDDVDYGHGTGESEDSAGETEIDLDPQCPNCMLMEMRVGDSFVADVNHFAEAAVYAVDNGASVIQSALGTLNHTRFAQAAADYAWENGVTFVASAADESAGHHNYPSALNHTMVVNSVTHYVDPVQVPRTYLAFNGCTNYGGYIWLAVASTSCSSDAVGQSAGIVGLIYSAAKNAVDKGVIAGDRSGKPLSSAEAKQILRAAGDDVDFSTPKPPAGPPNNFVTTLPASMRFITTQGWDQITGWGRLNADKAVRLVAAGAIPPEADLTSPRWWQPLGTTGSIDVVGRAAAPRASSFTWEVQVAPGVQPPRFPLSDEWTTVADGASTEAVSGKLATLDLAEVRALVEAAPPVYTPVDDPTSRDLPEQDAFRVRLVVADDRPETPDAIEQRQASVRDDPDLHPGYPKFLGADGAASPAFEDLDGDGTDELVLPDGNGFVHAYKANGTEALGWPVRTPRLPIPTTGRNAYSRGHVSPDVGAALLLGSPAIADLDDDGRPEVAVADLEGNLTVWDHRGRVRSGFPVRTEPAFSEEPGCEERRPACDDYSGSDPRDRINTVDHGFTAAPVAADLDPSKAGLELVAGANDGHVYAWHADGSRVAGWPVLLRDPVKVAAVDPRTHRITHVEGSEVKFGRKVITTPSVGDVDGDGDLEVAVNVNEEYAETPNASGLREQLLPLVQASGLVESGNTRVYLLHHDGTRHAPSDAAATSAHPHDQAYLPGWPVPIAMVSTELLPYVGEGSNGAPVLADTDGDGDLELGTASIGGPPYLLHHDGSSAFGDGPDGAMITMATALAEFKSGATDGPTFASLGGGAFGRLTENLPPSFAMGAAGLRRLLDVLLPEQQLLPEDHLGVWDPATGTFMPGFPAQVNDLMFFNTPTIVDIDGDGSSDVVQSTATYDVRAYALGGRSPDGWPKSTGNWNISTVASGDIDGDGSLDLSMATREGNLFLWRAAGPACGFHEWPKYQHDLRNTGAHGGDGRRPGALTGLVVDGSRLSWAPTGDDGPCGSPAGYVVTADGVTTRVEPSVTSVTLSAPPRRVEVLAVDDVGQKGFPAVWPPEAATGRTTGEPTGLLPSTGEIPGGAAPLPGLIGLAMAVAALTARRTVRS